MIIKIRKKKVGKNRLSKQKNGPFLNASSTSLMFWFMKRILACVNSFSSDNVPITSQMETKRDCKTKIYAIVIFTPIKLSKNLLPFLWKDFRSPLKKSKQKNSACFNTRPKNKEFYFRRICCIRNSIECFKVFLNIHLIQKMSPSFPKNLKREFFVQTPIIVSFHVPKQKKAKKQNENFTA